MDFPMHPEWNAPQAVWDRFFELWAEYRRERGIEERSPERTEPSHNAGWGKRPERNPLDLWDKFTRMMDTQQFSCEQPQQLANLPSWTSWRWVDDGENAAINRSEPIGNSFYSDSGLLNEAYRILGGEE